MSDKAPFLHDAYLNGMVTGIAFTLLNQGYAESIEQAVEHALPLVALMCNDPIYRLEIDALIESFGTDDGPDANGPYCIPQLRITGNEDVAP